MSGNVLIKKMQRKSTKNPLGSNRAFIECSQDVCLPYLYLWFQVHQDRKLCCCTCAFPAVHHCKACHKERRHRTASSLASLAHKSENTHSTATTPLPLDHLRREIFRLKDDSLHFGCLFVFLFSMTPSLHLDIFFIFHFLTKISRLDQRECHIFHFYLAKICLDGRMYSY